MDIRHQLAFLNKFTERFAFKDTSIVGNEPFFMTYGDGVCDVDINKLLEFHLSHGKTATLTAVKLAQEKGVLDIGGDQAVKAFREKSINDGAPINAGYMVLESKIFNYLTDDTCVFSRMLSIHCQKPVWI